MSCYYIKVEHETLAEAIQNHFYKEGYSSLNHALEDAKTFVGTGENFQVYLKGEIDMDAKNHFVTVGGTDYQLVHSGTR